MSIHMEEMLEELLHSVDRLEATINARLPRLCQTCGGVGKRRAFSEDKTNWVDCFACGGTGKEPPDA